MMSIPWLGFFYMLHERFWIWNLVDNNVFFTDKSNVHLFQLHDCFLSLEERHVVKRLTIELLKSKTHAV